MKKERKVHRRKVTNEQRRNEPTNGIPGQWKQYNRMGFYTPAFDMREGNIGVWIYDSTKQTELQIIVNKRELAKEILTWMYKEIKSVITKFKP